jgi:aminoglycoside phosphotransferase (APT) family kinase protein
VVFPISRDRILDLVAAKLSQGGIDDAEASSIAALIRRAQSFDERASIDNWREEVAESGRFDSRLEQLSSGEGAVSSDRPAPDAASLTTFLETATSSSSVRADDVRQLSHGSSKQSVIFDMVEDDRRTPLIMRRDMKESFVGTSVSEEFGFIKPLFDIGFPVPEPLWIETDAPTIEGCFLISRRVDGEVAGDARTGELSRPAKELTKQLADVLAQLHRVPVDTLPLPPELSAAPDESPVQNLVQHWMSQYQRQVAEPSALLEAGFERLLAGEPDHEQMVIVHGDIGYHNLMVDDSGTATLIDWELAHIGDPAEDICGARIFVEREGLFDYFLERYEAEGGPTPSAERLRYYDLFRLVRDASIMAAGMELFNDGKSADLVRMNHLHVVYTMYEERLGKAMENA